MSPGTDLLAPARSARATRDAAEVALAVATVDYCAAHRVDPCDALWVAAGEAGMSGAAAEFGDRPLALGGPGCPVVRESAVLDYAAVLGMSTVGGSSYVAEVLEVRYRLPRLWERVVAGGCPVWRARRIAAATICLCEDGADFVDTHLVGFAHSVSLAQLDRVVADALSRFQVEDAEAKRKAAAERRHATLDLDHAGEDGTVEMRAALDLPDALDLNAALAARAVALGRLGCEESLAVRRSMALGDLARDHLGQLALPDAADDTRDDTTSGSRTGSRTAATGRAVVLHLHLAAAAINSRCEACGCYSSGGGGEDERGRLGETHALGGYRGSLLAQTIRDWCAGAAQITVRPVLDLAEAIHCESYEASDRLSTQTALRDRTCAFPHCTRPATGCDDEHPVPWPTGPTATHNQAPLCRRHHRAKTFMHWAYVVLTPGLYLWTSPTGLRYLRSHAGTHELDPPAQTGPPPDPLPETAPPPRWRPLPRTVHPPPARGRPATATAPPDPDPDPPPF